MDIFVPSKRVEQQATRSHADRYLFLLAFAAGACAIASLKALGYAQALVTLTPCVILIGYALAIALWRRFQIPKDQAGDSCYYLGFLFTLTSLAVTLYQFSLSDAQIERLISNFGIAILTTLIGVVARVLFAQFRADPVDFEDQARMDLGDAVGRLRAALDNAVDELANFRQASQQRFQEDTAALFEEQRALLARHVSAVEGAFVAAAKGFEQTSVEFSERTKSINGQASTLAGRLERLGERIAAVKIDPGLVERRAEAFGVALDKLSLRLGETARMEEARGKATEAVIDRLGTLVDKLTGQLAAVHQAVPAATKLEATVGDADRKLAALGDRFEELQQALTRHSDGIRHMLQAETVARGDHRGALDRINAETLHLVREHNARLKQELAVERDLVGKVEDGLVRLVDGLTDRVNGAATPRGTA